MKSIRREILCNHLVLIVCTCIFITLNVLAHASTSYRYSGILQDYQEVNELVTINNRRKTDFKLYCKRHEDAVLQQYYEECELLNTSLEALQDKMQNDRWCKMMYRIVCQVVQHRAEVTEAYIQPGIPYNTGILEYLDEADLEIERCLNQLIGHYLEYLNTLFARYSQQVKLMNLFINLIVAASCFLTLTLNHRVSSKILQSIERLTSAAREITNQNFGAPDIEETAFIELNQVSGAFDKMKHTISHMITELKETHQMKERLAEAKIRELQMQMNPHFLFNSLSLVIRSIQLGERDTSILLVKAISRILRSSIEIRTTAIPLDDEIELLQSYLYIQKLHLKGRVTFRLDVRKSFGEENFMIPPLTIQPLVENSIQHGLKDRVSDGKVEILITEKPDYMEVVVADNGVGFPQKEERKSENGQQNTGVPKTSIGLNNVRERLKLCYRKDDVLQIERVDGFTRITLKLYKSEMGGNEHAAFDTGR